MNINIAEIKLTEEEVNAATDVLKSGGLRQGPQCSAFEEEFANYVGASHCLTNSNGSAALHMAYNAILEPGDEVLVPSFTFIATASMLEFVGAKPIICDVDPDTFLLDLDDAAKKLSDKTKAISFVHLFGNSGDINRVQEFARRNNLQVVWDSAQAHGTTYGGKDIGAYDGLACWSFYPSKNMFVGEGGMVSTRDADLYQHMKNFRQHGATGKYLHTQLGLNYRMTDVEAAIGRQQLKRLPTMISRRRANGKILREGLEGIDGVHVQTETPNSEHSYHQFCVTVDPSVTKINRDDLATKLGDKGISTGIHYPRGLHQQPVFVEKYGEQSLPVTESLCANILALPVHHGMTDDEALFVADSVREILM